MTAPVIALALGYLLGGFPTAHLVARSMGKDVFAVGSGSMGAMNTARNLGPGPGIVVLAVDAAKGALAVLLGGWLGGLDGTDRLAAAMAGALGAVTGHCFSPYVGFKGGKGLATAFGALLLVHVPTALYGLVLIAGLTLVLRRSGRATVVTLLAYPFVTFLALERSAWARDQSFLVATVVAVMCLVGLLRQLLAAATEGRLRRGGRAGA